MFTRHQVPALAICAAIAAFGLADSKASAASRCCVPYAPSSFGARGNVGQALSAPLHQRSTRQARIGNVPLEWLYLNPQPLPPSPPPPPDGLSR